MKHRYSTRRIVSRYVTLCLTATLSAPVLGAGGVALELGVSDRDADANRYGVAARWDWGAQWLRNGDWYLGGYWEVNVGYWDGDDGTTGNDSLVDFGATPVLRYQRGASGGFNPFVELGVGAHVHTEDGIADEDFDIPFAFGSHLGVGARFGARRQFELLYRYQHLSNAGLGDDNPGINFHVIHLGYWF